MNMIGTMTVIKGNEGTVIKGKGGVRTVMDGVVKNETQKQEQMHEMQMKKLIEKHEKEIAKLRKEIDFQNWYIDDLKRHRHKALEKKYGFSSSKNRNRRSMAYKLACVIGIIR